MIKTELDQRSTQSANPQFVLRPNCLLTRRPILFLTPPRSLFFYNNAYGFVAHVLFEHGYNVDIYQLPFQNIQFKKLNLHKNVADLNHCHLFIDSTTAHDLKDELKLILNSTITVIGSAENLNSDYFVFHPKYKKKSFLYWLHQKWCNLQGLQCPSYSETLNECPENIWHQLLDHCVQLAEIDFTKD